jgi:CRISPR type III-B/RAMP module RAMP protein Cmr6
MRSALLALKDKRAERGQHAGLILQRYLDKDVTCEAGSLEAERAVLQTAMRAVMNDDVRGLYRAAFDRWSHSLPSVPPSADLTTAGRLVIGLASESVLPAGIRLHHTYGMPLIPGSALKGLAAHYCHDVWGPAEEKFRSGGVFHQLLFGTSEDGGCITFNDAWLTPDSQQPLVLDVTTPHHPHWLDGLVPPTDFDSPTPLLGLSVTGCFRVAVSWCGPAGEEGKAWAELAHNLVCDALGDWGIGGKTASGYGRMLRPKIARVPAQTATATAIAVAKPTKPGRSGGVRVAFLGAHEKLTNVFWVKEEGKKRGLLKYGSPRTPLPDVDSEIEVYPTNNNPNAPEYRWDQPPRANSPRTNSPRENRPGGPRGRR